MSQLISEISKLSIPARIQLVQAILNTISEDSTNKKEYVLSTEQLKEVEKRSTALTNGEVKGVSWDSTEAELVRRYEL